MHSCLKCDYQSRHFFKLISHYRFVHSHEHGFCLSCSIDGCERTYSKIDSYLKHIKRNHGMFYQTHLSNSKEQFRNEDILESLVEVNDEGICNGNQMESDEEEMEMTIAPEINFQRKLGIFLLSLREKYKLPSVVIPEIVNEFLSMIDFHQAKFSQSLNEFSENYQLNEEQCNQLKMIVEEKSQVESAFTSLNSEYKINKFAKKQLQYVKPVEFKPDWTRNDTYQYVPIFETLQKLLSHDDVFSYIMNKHKSTDGIM